MYPYFNLAYSLLILVLSKYSCVLYDVITQSKNKMTRYSLFPGYSYTKNSDKIVCVKMIL